MAWDRQLLAEQDVAWMYIHATRPTTARAVSEAAAKRIAAASLHPSVSRPSTSLNERLPEILTHHFCTKWLQAQLPYLEANIPSGVVVLRMDFPERVELFSKTNVAQEEYFKVKVVLFLVASAMRFGPDQPVQDDLCIYMCPNSVQKNGALVQHCVKDTVKWLRSRARLSSVFYVFDRAWQEFSNCTALHALSQHEKKQGTHAHHVFEVEGESKGPVDGLGAAIKRLIRNICSRYLHSPTLFELYTELTRITKSAPIRGPNYRKDKQYRFVLVQPDEKATLTPGDTIPVTTKFYPYANTDTPGELSRRHMPCFCDCCMRGALPECRILWSLGEGDDQEAIDSHASLSKRVSTSPPVPVVFRALLHHIVELQVNT